MYLFEEWIVFHPLTRDVNLFDFDLFLNSLKCISGAARTYRHPDAPPDDAFLHGLRPGDGSSPSWWGRTRGFSGFALPPAG